MPEFRALLAGGGEMARRIRAYDWASTPLGPPRGWPQSLRSVLSICLHSDFPTSIYWGPEMRLLFNDAWVDAHQAADWNALGRPAREVWRQIWDVVGPQIEGVMRSGRAYSTLDHRLPIPKGGRIVESYWDYRFTPVAGEDGRVVGILSQGQETTARVFAGRRDALLVAIGAALRSLDNAQAMIAAAIDLAGKALDVGRVGYGEIDEARTHMRIEHNWLRAGMPDIRGTYPFGHFGDHLHAALSSGKPFGLDDAHARPDLAGTPLGRTYAAIGVRSGLVVPVVQNGRYTAAIFAQDDRPRAWTAHHEKLLGAVADTIWHEVGRVRAETALRDSERRHRLIFEQANDIMFTADLDQTITAANPASVAALGLSRDEVVGRSIADFVGADDFARSSAMLRRKLAEGGTTQYEVDVHAPGSGRLRWEINSTLAIDQDGKAIGLHAIARDVTARRAFEERQQLLIDELNHRVKNTLALVQGLALQSFRPDKSPDEARAAFQRRLATLAAAHDLLTREKWEGATLDTLVTDATRPYADAPGRIAAGGPAVRLNPKAAVSLALALHELVTNAAKYGALSVAEGRVAILWAAVDGRLRLSWAESGGPAVAAPERRGFGLRMIERALSNDLAGSVALAFDPAGFGCTIDAPMPASAAA